MFKLVVLLVASVAFVSAKPGAILAAEPVVATDAVVAAEPVVAAAPIVTSQSSQVYARNYNGLAAPLVASPYVSAPYIASPYVASPYAYSSYVAAPYTTLEPNLFNPIGPDDTVVTANLASWAHL